MKYFRNSSHEFSRAVLSVREDGLVDASLTATIEEHELGQQVESTAGNKANESLENTQRLFLGHRWL